MSVALSESQSRETLADLLDRLGGVAPERHSHEPLSGNGDSG